MAENPSPPPWYDRPDHELDPAEVVEIGEPFEPGDIETVGAVTIDDEPYDEIQISPWHYFRAAGISEEWTKAFAASYGVQDFYALCEALARVAREAAEAEPYSTHVLLWRDRHFDASAQQQATLARAKALVDELGELVSGSDWPVAPSGESIALRRQLIRYRQYLSQFEVVPLPGVEGRPSDEKAGAAFAVWSWAWPLLTGGAPEVRRPRPDQPPTGRRPPPGPTAFQRSFTDLCALFGLNEPTAATLRNWLKKKPRG